MSVLEAPPYQNEIAVAADRNDPRRLRLPKLVLGFEWQRYFGAVKQAVDEKPSRRTAVSLTDQHTSLGTTALPIGLIKPGVWRISVTVRVTTADGVSSAIQVSLGWTEGGVAQSESTTNLVGDSTTTREGKTFIIRADADTPITYSSVYASNTADAMRYSVDLVAEELALDS